MCNAHYNSDIIFAFKKLMSGFNDTYAAQMASNNYMNSSIVEYIEGIEVIKTFNQSQKSYQNIKMPSMIIRHIH